MTVHSIGYQVWDDTGIIDWYKASIGPNQLGRRFFAQYW